MAGGRTGWQGWQGGAAQAAPSRLLKRHWHSLRQGEASLPRRDAITPRAIAGMLDHVLMAERRPGGAVLLRYAGMAVNAVHGQDLTGRPLSALFEIGMRDQLMEALELAFSGSRTLDMELHSERGLTRPPLLARLTLLPLAGVGSEGVTLIGCLDLDGPPILPPRRFRIERVLGVPLTPHPDPRTLPARRRDQTADMAPEPGPEPGPGPGPESGRGPVLVWSGA